MSASQDELRQWVIDLRNDFHKYPELSGVEERTTGKICEILESLDVQIKIFDDITGAVGLLQGEQTSSDENKTIALRADIDALPVQETGNKSYKSVNDGIMHACGHDANTAILLGVAKKIRDSGLLKQIGGTVKFIFQPAEEELDGAKSMIARGVLEDPVVDRIIAGHMDPSLAVGTAGVFSHIGHASSDPFELVIRGKGTHGARPHQGINPVTAGGFFVTNLDSIIPRLINPARSAVISVGTFHAGVAGNVIPEKAVIKGSVRTHDEGVRKTIIRALKKLVCGIDTLFGTESDLLFRSGAPVGVNDRDVCKSLFSASVEILGKDKVKILPFIMGSEDFYYFTQQCPGAMMRFGCASQENGITYPLHSPLFDIHNDVLGVGVEVLYKAVENFFMTGGE